MDYHWTFWQALPAAALAGLTVAVVLGFPVFRLKGHYLAIATLGLSQIVQVVVAAWEPVTHGVLGVRNIPAPQVFGVALDSEVKLLPLLLAFASLAVLVTLAVERSHVGRTFTALRSGEFGLEAVGIRTAQVKVTAFALSGVFGAVAGSLFAHQAGYISPDFFGLGQIIIYLAMLLIGGKGTIPGCLLGATLITFLPEWLRFLQHWYMVVYGVVLILLMIFMPGGLVGLWTAVLRRLGGSAVDGARA